MGFMATMKAQKAYSLHGKGDLEGAKKLYQEAVDKGLDSPRFLLGYAVLLLREGSYQKAKDILVKTQKCPGLNDEMKIQMFVDYAACCFKLGQMDRGVELLERQHHKQVSGLVYQTLGYLYVEKYLPEARPVLTPADLPQVSPEQVSPEQASPDNQASPDEQTEPTAAEDDGTRLRKAQAASDAAWTEGLAAAKRFLEEAVEYDDEDPVCLDNLGQFYYRVLSDPDAAKPWFDKAIALKDGQIDTLWFLSRYDLASGNRAAAVEKLEKALEGRFSPLNYVTKEKLEKEISALKA